MNNNDITIIQGDDGGVNLTIKDDAGNSLIKAGNEFWLTVKKDVTDADADAILQISYIIETDSDSITLAITHDQSNVPIGSYNYDIQWKDNNGIITTVIKANFMVDFQITQAS